MKRPKRTALVGVRLTPEEYQRLKFMNARQMEVIQEQSVVIGRQVAKITELQSALALHATETANFPTMQEAGSGVPASVSKM